MGGSGGTGETHCCSFKYSLTMQIYPRHESNMHPKRIIRLFSVRVGNMRGEKSQGKAITLSQKQHLES